MKRHKHVVAKHFSWTKNAGTNDLSSNKEPKDIANDIIQRAKSVKIDVSKITVFSILPRKYIFNYKTRGVNLHLQGICSSNNFPLIARSNINPHLHINIKSLHLNSYGITS